MDFPKVHDIGELLRLLPPPIKLAITRSEQEELAFYATTARYRADYEPITNEDADKMLAVARRFREAAHGYLPREALE